MSGLVQAVLLQLGRRQALRGLAVQPVLQQGQGPARARAKSLQVHQRRSRGDLQQGAHHLGTHAAAPDQQPLIDQLLDRPPGRGPGDAPPGGELDVIAWTRNRE